MKYNMVVVCCWISVTVFAVSGSNAVMVLVLDYLAWY